MRAGSAPPLSRLPSCLIGIDGGGSGTRARLASSDGSLHGHGEAGPSGLSQGIDAAWTQIRRAIDAAAHDAGLAPPSLIDCAIGMGLAGANVPALHAAFVAAAPATAALRVVSDARTSLLGAHAGAPGVIVACGTGSVGAARHADGRWADAGGWGFPIGDEGSGAWLGFHAVQRAQHALDGRAPVGALVEAVWAATGYDAPSLLGWCAQAGQRAYAQLAPLVFAAAASDAWAAGLLDAAAWAIDDLVTALDPQGELPLVVTGSVGQRLVPRLPAHCRSRIGTAAGDAADGALRLIRQTLAAAGAPR